MTKTEITIIATIVVIIAAIIFGSVVVQSRNWQVQPCGNAECVANFLNQLSVQDAVQAKVIAVNSQWFIYYRK